MLVVSSSRIVSYINVLVLWPFNGSFSHRFQIPHLRGRETISKEIFLPSSVQMVGFFFSLDDFSERKTETRPHRGTGRK